MINLSEPTENLITESLVVTENERTQRVPNRFPTLQHSTNYRIALIGEAPGADEVAQGQPFVGVSGRWLDYLLNRVGILRSACYLGNISQSRPNGNDISLFEWNGPEIQDGLNILADELRGFNPNICVLLGGTALRAAKGYPESITKWRGSLFYGAPNTPFAGRKCMATFHPASSLRVYEQTPLLLFDLKRARVEAETPNLVLPSRTVRVAKTVDDVVAYCKSLEENPVKIGTDIEGYVDNLTCISFASDALTAFVVPFSGPSGNYWNEADEVVVWALVKQLLENSNIPKVLQNGLYDRFVLAYTYGILICNTVDDTLVKHWELFCELEKKLSVQCSIYTKEPYYKDERGSEGFDEFWTYNGKDSCVTLEICDRQDALLRDSALAHYRFNMEMQNPLLYMELRGMRYDSEQSRELASQIRKEVYILQQKLNVIAECAINIQTEEDVIKLLTEVMYVKKMPAILAASWPEVYCRKSFLDNGSFPRALELCKQGYPFDDVRNGELSMLLEKHLNTASTKQMQQFLYKELMMPPQVKRITHVPTTDALAILKLYKWAELHKPKYAPILKLILKLTNLRTSLETLEINCDLDGRIRCSYNIVGTETGRLSCKQSPTRSGYNLQTVTKKQRKLFLSDEGYSFFQCDLSGADGWTVAAHCARLGDWTMLEDYRAGLKPAKIIALMYYGESTNIGRDELRSLCKGVPRGGEAWLYMACKRVQHGSNYLMGKATMSDQILQDSWKYGEDIIFVQPAICQRLQDLYFARYPGVQQWHKWVENEIKTKKQLTSANGHVRKFFGRPNDHDTLKQALSDEPQNNTTYATNRAVLSLWNDRENRTADGALIIEPLHQVHDAVCGQFPTSRLDWALAKIRSYFSNNLTIAGTSICIPFEGAWGKSWGELTNEI